MWSAAKRGAIGVAFTALTIVACASSDDGTISSAKDAGIEGGNDVIDSGPTTFCGVNQTKCGLSCAFLQADPVNCGACGHKCLPFPSGAVHCVNGICADPACGAGYADCDGDPKNGCEVNVGGNLPGDCGVCGRSCETSCNQGVCTPNSLTKDVVAPFSIALAGTDLFVTDIGKDQVPTDGRILKVPTGGGAATVLASAQSLPRGIAVDANNVYYTLYGAKGSAQGSVAWVGRDGTCGAAPTCPVVLTSMRKAPWAIALDNDYVYWTERGTVVASNADAGVFRIKKDGTAPVETVVYPTGESVSLALSDTSVYFSADGHVYSTPKTGGLAVEVGTADGGLAIFGSTLYMGDTSRVAKQAVAGGSPSFLFITQGATALAVDSISLFVYESGQVYESQPSGACPRAGSCPVKVMGFAEAFEPSPSPFTFDASYVYGAAPDGRLLKVPR
jgi:hypothetical protein